MNLFFFFTIMNVQGHPIVGDSKYGARQSFKNKDIALHAYSLTILHPITNIEVRTCGEYYFLVFHM